MSDYPHISDALRAFLANLIDYAGLFPPARLPLDEAIRHYARYRRGPERWMLARFIVPAARLDDLSAQLDALHDDGPPFRFSVLGRSGDDADRFLDGVRADAWAIAAFRARHGAGVVADFYETRLPPDMTRLDALLVETRAQLAAVGGLRPFFEAPSPDEVGAVVGAVARHGADAGFKLRCGGVTPDAFPSTEQVALTLLACRQAGVPMKFTAGLHHPLRHHDDAIGAMMHGFLNVFGAGLLLHAHGLDLDQLRAILDDPDAQHFRFSDDAFAWRHLRATTDEIRALRHTALISYGSCSFDEPRDDLRALGLLPAERSDLTGDE